MEKKSNEQTVQMTVRSNRGVLLVIMALAVAVVAKLITISVKDNKFYAEIANDNHFSNITIPANRGTIYDTNGTPLAWSATVYKIYIDPQTYRSEMETIEKVMLARKEILDSGESLPEGKVYIPVEDLENQIVAFLADKLQIKEETIRDAMVEKTQYRVLKTQVDKSIADEIDAYFADLGMVSVTRQADTKRYYPQNDLASQVIGFTGSDGYGQYGLEAKYDDYLSGTNGRTIAANDAFGREMPYRYAATYAPQDGDSLYLSLDVTLQYYLEKNLKEMCDTFEVRNRACGIMMNPKTGAIYAMATYPSFDLNNPYDIADPAANAVLDSLPESEYTEQYIAFREKQWKNKALTELYVPGSVFKIFTTAAAIEEKVVDPETSTFNCSGSYTIPGVDPIGCHNTSGHGFQTFSKALTNSCNPAFIEIGLDLGVERFVHYLEAFGLSETTGIDLPGEESSIYYPADRMSIVDLASSSFGQATKLTPIEMITGISAAINGGYLVEPHVVSKIVSSDGNVVENIGTTVKRQVVSEETSAEVCKLLQAVVDDNGGSNAYIKGYAIGGKSGTSQKLDEYPDEDQYVASYACFAPADDPEVVLLVLADEPNPDINYYGSRVAAPYARAIMEEALPYLGFYPAYTDEEYSQLDVTIPLLLDKKVDDAKATLDEMGVYCEVYGEGDTIVKQCPLTNASVSRGGTVILYTDQSQTPKLVEVPDLKDYSASSANDLLTSLGLNYVAVGASSDKAGATVQEQSVAPGTKVEVGTVVRLTYLTNDQTG